MLLGAKAAVLGEKAARDFVLGHALAQLGAQPLHRLVVRGGGGAHEVELAGILDGAREVDGGRAQAELARGVGAHEREQPACGEHLVDTERRASVAGFDDERDRVLGVIEDLDLATGCSGIREEAVAEHDRLDAFVRAGEVEGIEALVGEVPVASEVPDGHRVGDEHLAHAHVFEVVEYATCTLHVHSAFLSPGMLRR